MHSLHNTKLYVNESNYIDKLSKAIISRSNYLNTQDINITHNKIKNKKKILILPNDISESLIFEKYKLIFHGILPCGTKVTLIINKIYPYVDIDYNENISEEENINHIKSLFKNERLLKMLKGKIPDYNNIELKHGKKFMYFNEKESKFIRIYFNKLYHRICFIRLLVKLNIPSYNNDLNNYYRVVSRSFKIFLSSWNVINNYTIERNSKYKSEYVLSADINDIKPYTDNMYDKYFSDVNIDLIRKDKCISMAFDIEQYSSKFDPLRPDIVIMPSGKIKEDEIFNIGFTYQFINEKDSFLNIALLTKEANEHEDYFTIMCSNEKVLLNVFSYINSILQPDYIMEFNGSEFDWISIYDKCIYYKNIELFCENFSIKKLSNYDTLFAKELAKGKKFNLAQKAAFFKLKTNELVYFRTNAMEQLKKTDALYLHFNALNLLDESVPSRKNFAARDEFIRQFDFKSPKLLFTPNLRAVLTEYFSYYPLQADSISKGVDTVMKAVDCKMFMANYVVDYLTKLLKNREIVNNTEAYKKFVQSYLLNDKCKVLDAKQKTTFK
jgi:hypothetical protein